MERSPAQVLAAALRAAWRAFRERLPGCVASGDAGDAAEAAAAMAACDELAALSADKEAHDPIGRAFAANARRVMAAEGMPF